MWLDIYMTNNTNNTHEGHELMVSGGVVRCNDCHEWLHDHKDSDPKPGLVSSNQWK